MAQQKNKNPVINISIPKEYKPAARKAIAQDIIDHIVDRTIAGKKSRKGASFAPYSKEYTKSLDFKNAGKTKKVNLKLTGDMLAEIDLVNHKAGNLRVGYGRGNPERKKAIGNIQGTYGQKKPIKGKARDFLTLSKKELTEILKKYPLEDKDTLQKKIIEVLAIRERAEKLTKNVVNNKDKN